MTLTRVPAVAVPNNFPIFTGSNIVRKLRMKWIWRQRDLALVAGVHVNTIKKIENRRTNFIRRDVARMICGALDAPMVKVFPFAIHTEEE